MSGDLYWDNVSSLLHFDGADGSTTFTDQKGVIWTPASNAQIDTALSKFGGASGLFDGVADNIKAGASTAFGFGSGDYTVEGWLYQANQTVDRCIFDNRDEVTEGIAIYASASGADKDRRLILANNAAIIAGTATTQFPINTWTHWAVCRASGTVRGFISGVEVWSVVDSRTLASTASVTIGANYATGQEFVGSLDEIRITKGVARYTANFTPPDAPFPDTAYVPPSTTIPPVATYTTLERTGYYPIPVYKQNHGFIRAQDGATQGATIGVDLSFAGDGQAGVKELGISTGLLSGGKITINPLDNTRIDIDAGSGIWVDFTQSPPSVLTQSWSKIEGVPINDIAIQPVTYISLDRDLNVIQTPAELLNMERRKWVELGIAVHTNRTNINVINTLAATVESTASQLHDFMEAVGPFNKSGNVYSAVGGNLQIRKTAGDIFKFGVAYDTTPFDPHTIDQSSVNPITFRYRKRDSVEYADTTSIDPNNYDLGGVLTAVQANRYTVQRIYMFQSGLTRIQYGQQEYQTLNEAIGTFEKESFQTELNMRTNGILRAFLVVKQGATNLADSAQAQFFDVSKFGTATGAGGGGIDASTIITALGYTPANQTRDLIAGDGLIGGGDLSATRTVSMGTPSSVTSTSTNSTTADSHTHALVINDGSLTIAKTSGLQTALDAKQAIATAWNTTNLKQQADFTNPDLSLRTYFQTNVANAASNAGILPNGTGTTALFSVWNNSSPVNASTFQLRMDPTKAILNSSSTGTGTVYPIYFQFNNVDVMTIATNGSVSMLTSGSEFYRAAANSGTLTRQPRTFVQSTDPGAAAADDDLWIW